MCVGFLGGFVCFLMPSIFIFQNIKIIIIKKHLLDDDEICLTCHTYRTIPVKPLFLLCCSNNEVGVEDEIFSGD